MGYDRLDCYSMLFIYIYTCINDQHSENCLSKNLWYTLQIAILIGKLWWTIKIWPYLQTNPRTLYFHGRCSLKSAQCTRISYNTAIHGSEWDLALHLWRGPHKFGSVGNEPYKNPGIHRILYPQLYLDHRPHLYITGIHFQLPTDGLLVVCCVSVRNGLSQWYNNLKYAGMAKAKGVCNYHDAVDWPKHVSVSILPEKYLNMTWPWPSIRLKHQLMMWHMSVDMFWKADIDIVCGIFDNSVYIKYVMNCIYSSQYMLVSDICVLHTHNILTFVYIVCQR